MVVILDLSQVLVPNHQGHHVQCVHGELAFTALHTVAIQRNTEVLFSDDECLSDILGPSRFTNFRESPIHDSFGFIQKES